MKKYFSLFLFFAMIFAPEGYAQNAIDEDQLIAPTAHEVLEQLDNQDSSVEHNQHQNGISLNFTPEARALNETHKAALLMNIINPFKSLKNKRIKVISYAVALEKTTEDPAISARRLSLERALNVREFLKEHGISPRSVDMFPIGQSRTTDSAQNLIEVHISE